MARAQDAKHKDEIDLESWSWGAVQHGTHACTGGGGGAGKVRCRISTSPCRCNKATPKLFLACATGEHIKKAVLTCRKAGKDQQEYLEDHLHRLLVSSYQTGGSHGAIVIPTESDLAELRERSSSSTRSKSRTALWAAPPRPVTI